MMGGWLGGPPLALSIDDMWAHLHKLQNPNIKKYVCFRGRGDCVKRQTLKPLSLSLSFNSIQCGFFIITLLFWCFCFFLGCCEYFTWTFEQKDRCRTAFYSSFQTFSSVHIGTTHWKVASPDEDTSSSDLSLSVWCGLWKDIRNMAQEKQLSIRINLTIKQ